MFNKQHKIGEAISKLRKEKGWTQNELAEKLQVSDKAISKWESSKGDPSIEFLPMLADLFGVTLDYLMIGKEQEEKIVTISKLELCAKNDDIEAYKSLKLSLCYKDEEGKCILDYIFTYQSKRLFKELVINDRGFANNYLSRVDTRGKDVKKFYENIYYMRLLCNDPTIVRDFVRLEYADTTIEQSLKLRTDSICYNGQRIMVPRKIVSDRIINYILYGKDIDQELKSKLMGNYSDSSVRYYSPALSYPYYVLYAMKNDDWELAEQLIENAINFNKENREKIKKDSYHIDEAILGYINFPKEVFEFALEKEQYHIVQLANLCNKDILENPNKGNLRIYDGKMVYVADEYKVYVNKIKFDSKLTQPEKDFALCIHCGVICLDELIELNDFDLYEKTINQYSICTCEILYKEIVNKNYKPIFKYSLENNIHYLIEDLKNRDENKLLSDFAFHCCGKDLSDEINKDYLRKYVNEKKSYSNNLYSNNRVEAQKSKEIIESLFKSAKDHVFLLKVLNKDLRFIEKACKSATQKELDDALTQVEPNNFKAINILLNYGAKLHKVWTEDDGWGYMVACDEIDEIGTEILKKKIKEMLGEE